MSTDKKKKKRGFPRIERIKILEYGSIALVILLFLGLALLYGGKKDISVSPEPDASPTPVPTDDLSIRGKNVLDAIEGSAFSLSYQQDHYDLTSENGASIRLSMRSDDSGICQLTVEVPLCADPQDDSPVSVKLKAENKKTADALRDLFDLLMPVFHRTVSDSDTIVKQCIKVAHSGEPYSKHLGHFTVRIQSDPEAVPQYVTVDLIRDP